MKISKQDFEEAVSAEILWHTEQGQGQLCAADEAERKAFGGNDMFRPDLLTDLIRLAIENGLSDEAVREAARKVFEAIGDEISEEKP